eukprot:CAMPEP_0183465282 /NCGR_PEP_ID=MMETSP0370-20130417/147011_1 /TAXON_ID=268820 /ORGANISM="Peridinium aciculiferum, Strain PAER-2" /LENGTH=224 /DNA_ID=CAMNT_0025657485 /DNA_START=272 /DNA_END=943 /DNA_ORIENTATION=+
MVAAAIAQVLLADHVELTEEVVDPLIGDTCVGAGHESLELANGLGANLRVEGADRDDTISGQCIAMDRPHDLLRGHRSSMAAAAVDAERAMVVYEEYHLLARLVNQADPHDASTREELLGLVNCDDLRTLAGQLPASRLERHREGVRPLNRSVVCTQATLDHDPRDVIALLQTHDIRHRSLDDGNCTAAVATPLTIQTPPQQVVRQGLHLHNSSKWLSNEFLAG